MAGVVFQSSPIFRSSSMDFGEASAKASDIFGSQLRSLEVERTHVRFGNSFECRRTPAVRSKVVMEYTRMIQDAKAEVPDVPDPFRKFKHRFLRFKEDQYYGGKLEQYKRLSKAQAPKFMVIACADSRVCPSTILGFELGEAFVIRNVANLVPPLQHGFSETNAALEFAINSLGVENILIIGHSCCGGLAALMDGKIEDNSSSHFDTWMRVGKPAMLLAKSRYKSLTYEEQCRHCEKESIGESMSNLLSYPWIHKRVRAGTLLIHGGYYNFIDCTFEKWTLDIKSDGWYAENREFWS